MANTIDDLHMVLITCGVSVDATCTLIISNEYLTSIRNTNLADMAYKTEEVASLTKCSLCCNRHRASPRKGFLTASHLR